MQSLWGWRGAFIGAGALGFAVAALLLTMGDDAERQNAPAPARGRRKTAWAGGFCCRPRYCSISYSSCCRVDERRHVQLFRRRLGALDDTPVATANVALSGHLFLSALGVLVGGVVATRTARHGLVAASGSPPSWRCLLFAYVDLGSLPLIAGHDCRGFFSASSCPRAT